MCGCCKIASQRWSTPRGPGGPESGASPPHVRRATKHFASKHTPLIGREARLRIGGGTTYTPRKPPRQVPSRLHVSRGASRVSSYQWSRRKKARSSHISHVSTFPAPLKYETWVYDIQFLVGSIRSLNHCPTGQEIYSCQVSKQFP